MTGETDDRETASARPVSAPRRGLLGRARRALGRYEGRLFEASIGRHGGRPPQGVLVLLLAVLVAAAVPVAADSPAVWEPQVGQRFPDLRLPSLDGGESLSLEDFRGQKVVLHVFASW